MRWKDWWLRLEAEFALPSWSCHGPEHWRSVERNAIVLASRTPGADVEVARAFALFHDSQRLDDGWDEDHGPRAARFVELHRQEIPLTDEQITARLNREGIQVTRRTVAKYREDMRIPSTHQRRVKA